MSCIVLDCLLPNSISVCISCSDETELWKFKGLLWQKAKHFYKALGDSETYSFLGVTTSGYQQRFFDENKKIKDLKLFSPFLNVVQKNSVQNPKILNMKLDKVIGKSLSELELKDDEIQSFRKSILKIVEESVLSRHKDGVSFLSCYQNPCELEPSPHLLPSIINLLTDGMLHLKVWYTVTDSVTVAVPWDIFPEAIISETLKSNNKFEGITTEGSRIGETEKYALKICGTNEFLMARRPITQYKIIRKWITQRRTPQLFLVYRGEVHSALSKYSHSLPTENIVARSKSETSNSDITSSLWHPSMEGRLKIHVVKAKLPNHILNKCFVRVGLYHGGEALSSIQETRLTPLASWDEWIQLDLPIQEIPRASKLCFALCFHSQGDGKKKKKEEVMHAYGNVPMFDFKGGLIHGHVHIPLTEKPPGVDDFIYPQGLQVSLQKNFNLEVHFEQRFSGVQFPDEGQMDDYARYLLKLNQQEKQLLKGELEKISSLCGKDPSYKMTREEKNFLWSQRYHCLKIPDSLPKLASAVRWSCRDQVCQFYLLLDDWPLVSTETALELLQFTFPDPKVREHAVLSLSRTLPDEKLTQYLLQLVYSLKHEIYLESSLLHFLLHKALTNKNIGYLFYWYVRSEGKKWPGYRAFVILETYCRGLGPELKCLIDQVEMVEKMALLAENIKSHKNDFNKEGSKYLHRLLAKNEYNSTLQHLPSPLNPGLLLGRLRISECKVLDSARRPLYLAWENSDPMASHFSLSHALIFKSGDDLRQDMLTLQVIGIMSQVWNEEGLDLSMMPYSCLVTGFKTGLIEVVPNAKTVYSIQKRARLGAIQFDSSQLYKWIKDKNPGDRLQHAIETFCRSCAGYCVATFVLGIGDRHPDNIMVNEGGQIFHIDFGHFLGNFKKKFGIQRERVPFVLTQDFLKVIAAGADNPKESIEFQRFQELCGRAYLGLRKHTRLILSLFSLLISTGLPELQSLEDVSYLKKTLAIGASEAEALQYFQSRFHEAYDGAWTTKLDWFFHSVKHR